MVALKTFWTPCFFYHDILKAIKPIAFYSVVNSLRSKSKALNWSKNKNEFVFRWVYCIHHLHNLRKEWRRVQQPVYAVFRNGPIFM